MDYQFSSNISFINQSVYMIYQLNTNILNCIIVEGLLEVWIDLARPLPLVYSVTSHVVILHRVNASCGQRGSQVLITWTFFALDIMTFGN